MDAPSFVTALRGAAEYVHAHHGATFVVVITGESFQSRHFERLIGDIALLSSLGVNIVLVHGARPQIDAELALRGIESRYVGDRRITDTETMAAVKAAVGSLRMDIEAALASRQVNTPSGGAGLTVVGGTWVTARPVGVRDGIDHLLTGEVRGIEIDQVRAALAADQLVLLSPVGYSPSGEVFNLRNADIAQSVAVALGADKLVFVLESEPRSWSIAAQAGDAGQLLLAEAEAALLSPDLLDSLTGEDRNCVRAAAAAGRRGVRRVHLVSGHTDGALLQELYTRDGSGLLFYDVKDYEATRTATVADVPGILALIRPLEDAGVLVPRSREQVETDINRFQVMVRDGTVIACNAVFDYADDAAELACVAVHPEYRGRDRAETLLLRAEQRARARGIDRLFALTTHTTHWFLEHGFAVGSPRDLPHERRATYNAGRNSVVLVKPLGTQAANHP